MGLLTSENEDQDYQFAFRTARCVQNWWNENQSKIYGFRLGLYAGSLRDCCKIGSGLFDGPYFARPPGPFKRTSAFVIIGRLNPFFGFHPLAKPKEHTVSLVPSSEGEKQAWLARIMTLMIPAILSGTRANIGGNHILLSEWVGFPSPHFKLEFLAWLRWLDRCESYRDVLGNKEWEKFYERRLARMVMATSLMIEACYYASNPAEGTICGNTASCMESLGDDHELDLIYDMINTPQEPEFAPEKRRPNL